MTKTTMTKTPMLILLTTLFISSCATICTVSPTKTTIDGKEITFAESQMPCDKVADFDSAVALTIKAIYSDDFERQLESYIKDSVGTTGEHVAAWNNLKASEIVQKMRVQINGTYADTYGGIKGLWLFVIYHNLAKDGTENGPILFNRIPLNKRTPLSMVNTIAHEVSHRVDLTHPHSDTHDMEIAFKEPAYIVGDIVERVAADKMKSQ
jgi:hypothetical protein